MEATVIQWPLICGEERPSSFLYGPSLISFG